MKVKELIEQLSKYNPEDVVITGDANCGYYPLHGTEKDIYFAETPVEGNLAKRLFDDEGNPRYTKEYLAKGEECVVLW